MNKLIKFATYTLICALLVGCGSNKKPKITEEEQKASEIAWQKGRAELLEREKNAEKEKLRIAEYRKEAGKRNAEKLKNLGFPSNFTEATISLNFLGTWSPFSTVDQWLGLMLENKKIQSLKRFTYQGNPGVFVKEENKPELGFIFRIEGKDAFPYAIQHLGQTSLVKINEHINFMTAISSYINQADLIGPNATEKNDGEPSWAAKITHLGLSLSDLTEAQKKEARVRSGVRVHAAVDAAARAGIREGDLILAVANNEVSSFQVFESLMARIDQTRPVSVLIRRGDRAQYVLIRPAP
jgi:hypothetical protein